MNKNKFIKLLIFPIFILFFLFLFFSKHNYINRIYSNINFLSNNLPESNAYSLEKNSNNYNSDNTYFPDFVPNVPNFDIYSDSDILTRPRHRLDDLINGNGTSTFNCGICGRGFPGQVAFWVLRNTISGDNNLFWDNINKRLGIGTTSPQARLHVIGNTIISDNLNARTVISGTTTASRICLGNVCRSEWPAGGGISGNGIQGYIPIWANSTSLFTSAIYQSNNNIGIGTTSPQARLHVIGNTIISDNLNARTVISGTTTASRICLGNVCRSEWPSGGTNYWILSGNSLYATPTTANVGIGTANPEFKLEVRNGDIYASNYIRAGLGICIRNNCINDWTTSTIGSNIFGSGLRNYLTKWTGTSSIGMSIIYESDENTIRIVGTNTTSTIFTGLIYIKSYPDPTHRINNSMYIEAKDGNQVRGIISKAQNGNWNDSITGISSGNNSWNKGLAGSASGFNSNNYGVYGISENGSFNYGLYGRSENGANNYGVYGTVYGTSSFGYGIYGIVYGTSSYAYGVYGRVYSYSESESYGIIGINSDLNTNNFRRFGVFGSGNIGVGASGNLYDFYTENRIGKSYFAGKLGIGVLDPTSKIDINNEFGYNQLRLRKSFTPNDSNDTRGNIGEIVWDNNYIYVKTNQGWKRAELRSF
jgi:hypothetical protein